MPYLSQDTLTFNTYLEPYQDPITKRIVEGAVDQTIESTGSLQPFINVGKMQVAAPSGFTMEDSWMFVTKDDLPVTDDLTSIDSATTVIDGVTHYIAKKFAFNARSRLSTGRNFYVLIREKMKEGSV